jgi:hypothetical protein
MASDQRVKERKTILIEEYLLERGPGSLEFIMFRKKKAD